MASPIGHTLAGYAVRGLLPARYRRHTSLVLLAVAMGNVADVDFVPGLLVGMPAFYHQGPSHSLLVGVVVSLLVAGGFHLAGRPFGAAFAVGLMGYTSHLVLDMLSPDARPPLGVPLLWPFSPEHVLAPVALFPGVRHAATATTSVADWLGSVLAPANLRAVAVETALLGPLAVWAARRRRARPRPARDTSRSTVPRRAVEESQP